MPGAVHHGASGQNFLRQHGQAGGGGGSETVPLSYIEITSKNQGGSADMVPWMVNAPI
jgi:hypothetical protein